MSISLPTHLERGDGYQYPRICGHIIQIELTDDLILGHMRLEIDLVGQYKEGSGRELLVFQQPVEFSSRKSRLQPGECVTFERTTTTKKVVHQQETEGSRGDGTPEAFWVG